MFPIRVLTWWQKSFMSLILEKRWVVSSAHLLFYFIGFCKLVSDYFILSSRLLVPASQIVQSLIPWYMVCRSFGELFECGEILCDVFGIHLCLASRMSWNQMSVSYLVLASHLILCFFQHYLKSFQVGVFVLRFRRDEDLGQKDLVTGCKATRYSLDVKVSILVFWDNIRACSRVLAYKSGIIRAKMVYTPSAISLAMLFLTLLLSKCPRVLCLSLKSLRKSTGLCDLKGLSWSICGKSGQQDGKGPVSRTTGPFFIFDCQNFLVGIICWPVMLVYSMRKSIFCQCRSYHDYLRWCLDNKRQSSCLLVCQCRTLRCKILRVII